MKNKLHKIAQEIIKCEQECSQGIEISKNMAKIEKLMVELPFEELLELNKILEKKFLTN